MELFAQYHFVAAATVARVFLGFLFFFQGYDAVFRVGMSKAIASYEEGFRPMGVPRFFTVSAAWFTSLTELICGFLLVFGLFEYAALYLLGLNLLIAATGFGIVSPLWDMKHVFPRLVLLLFLLLLPVTWNTWTLDHLFFYP
ncbi:MAG TPA: DoxX family membrane protein [Fluviicola sp.]|nr:DoxX family membrane protein [Fluviicola sp.]